MAHRAMKALARNKKRGSTCLAGAYKGFGPSFEQFNTSPRSRDYRFGVVYPNLKYTNGQARISLLQLGGWHAVLHRAGKTER